MKSCRAGIYLFPRRPRLQLDPESYERLREHVLQRDGWPCQRCGRPDDLHVHHINPRSQLGDDADHNLITLCTRCHRLMHSGRRETRTERKIIEAKSPPQQK